MPPSFTIGDTVFYDVNNNGVMDSYEAGAAGISVDAYRIVKGAQVWKGGALTDANGKYAFTASEEGDYRVKFTVPAKNVVKDG